MYFFCLSESWIKSKGLSLFVPWIRKPLGVLQFSLPFHSTETPGSPFLFRLASSSPLPPATASPLLRASFRATTSSAASLPFSSFVSLRAQPRFGVGTRDQTGNRLGSTTKRPRMPPLPPRIVTLSYRTPTLKFSRGR
ncbi:hypothetical protein VIGAN_06023700 [Vigna angularis var. angularis]|uniref:Uncharacterized protein n=1 Tax=Vigna angularis var. angularis TaxID=157739 RepID=A0A0S3S911_PHAAN|nr:hypothetical protein VIGAN_06023700 [Vigna angularis var. angularis]